MNNYKITISYDGTDYCGWQQQKAERTVSQVLSDTFKYAFSNEIILRGASRTDAGVHAMGQVAVFSTDLPIEKEKLIYVWNNILPPDIKIREIEKVSSSFCPRHCAEKKIYWYHIFTQQPLPFVQRYGYYCNRPFDLDKFKKGLEVFLGIHDFRSFCTGLDMGNNTTREIDSIFVDFVKRYNAYRVTFTGRSFLRYMIRRIVGGVLEVACREDLKVEDLKKALDEKNPQQHFPTAKAKGLCLFKIFYGGKDE